MNSLKWKDLLNLASIHKKKIIIGQILALIAVSVSLPIPLLFPMLIDEVLLKKPDWLTGSIDNFFTIDQPYMYIVIVMIVTMFLRTMFFVFNVFQVSLFTKVSKDIVFKLRVKLLKHLEHVSVAEYEALGGGGVSSKLVTDINTIDNFVSVSISKFIISTLSLIGVAIVLVYLDPFLALVLFILNPSVVAITFFLGKKIKKLKKAENSKIEKFQDSLNETLDLFVQVRTHNQEKRYIGNMIQSAKAIKVASSSFGWKSESASMLSSLIFLSGFELLRALSMIMVLLSDLSIGQMFAIMGYLWFMITPLQEMLGIIFSFQNANAALERLDSIVKLKHEPAYHHNINPFKDGDTNEIELQDVHFAYNKDEVLKGVNLKMYKGKTIALIGPSGSGKSTLAQIILGLYAIKSGDIKVDGNSYKDIGLDVMRQNIALVLQSPKMFNDTLWHNLTLGEDISEDIVKQAISSARLDEVYKKLPDGFNTMLGKDGVRLSGGEKQRVAIARMLILNPSVIILDESTSALDIDTENMLFKSLRENLKDKTMLIIAHRLSTIEHADYIYVIKDGKVDQSGTYHELLKKDGHFKDFVNKQS